jgi:hypothetical protein
VRLLHLRQTAPAVELWEFVVELQTVVVVLMGNKVAGMVAAGMEAERKDDPQFAMVDYWPL